MIKQPMNRFGDNTSIAPSKSSKTIRSKFIANIQQQTRQPPIYFKDDPMRQQITLRAKKINNQISPKLQKPDHLGKVSQLVQDLQKRKDQTKRRLEGLKQQNQREMERIHPFTPEKRKIPKYVVSGDILRRNQVWLQQKTKRQLHLKEQITLQQLKECTFSPNIESKKTSQIYLKTRKSLTPQKNVSAYSTQQNFNTSTFYSPSKGRKKQITNREYQTAKKFLVSKIMNTHIL